MGCLCPRKAQYPAPTRDNKQYPPAYASTQHAFPLQSDRIEILPASNPNNYPTHPPPLSPQYKYPLYPTNPSNPLNNRSNIDVKSGAGLLKQQILVSQIGGSKLQKSISIISTEADITSLESSLSSNRSLTQDMVVVAKGFKARDKLRKIKKRFYSLIENKLYVKKDPTSLIKIKSPVQQLNLFCSTQTLKETIHLTDGIPIENIRIVSSQPLTYLVESNLDVSISLRLQCSLCGNKRMRVSSSCKLPLNFVCGCSSKQFTITSIKTEPSSLPIWYQGRKITTSSITYIPGSEMRGVGCNICWRIQDCSAMECGCLRCSGCSWEHPHTKCMLCV